jgi:molybdate-binding protein
MKKRTKVVARAKGYKDETQVSKKVARRLRRKMADALVSQLRAERIKR